MTCEDRSTARCVLCRTCGLVRARDLHRANVRVAHVVVVVRDCAAALRWLRKTFRLPELTDEGDADDVRSRTHGDPGLESGIAGDLHVLFPLGIAGEAGLAVAGIAQRSRP